MHCFAIIQQNYTQISVFCFWNLLPPSDSAVRLNHFVVRPQDNLFNPLQPDIFPVRTFMCIQEILRVFHVGTLLYAAIYVEHSSFGQRRVDRHRREMRYRVRAVQASSDGGRSNDWFAARESARAENHFPSLAGRNRATRRSRRAQRAGNGTLQVRAASGRE